MAERCAVVGVGQTHHVKVRDDVSLAGLLREASIRALDDAEMDWKDVDAVVIGTAPDSFEGVMMPELYLADALGAAGKPIMRVHTAGSVGGSTAIVASHLVQSGVRERVLTVAFEKQSEHHLGSVGRPQRRRWRRRLLRPAHPRVHRTFEGPRVRRLDGGGQRSPQRAQEPVRPPEDGRHLARNGA